MPPKDARILALRATFAEVVKAQEELRVMFDKLVNENRPLRTEERGDYLRLISLATLGQGHNINIHSSGWFTETSFGNADLPELTRKETPYTADAALRWLAYWTDSTFNKKPISHAWMMARELAFKCYPIAISMALKLSPEKGETSGTIRSRENW